MEELTRPPEKSKEADGRLSGEYFKKKKAKEREIKARGITHCRASLPLVFCTRQTVAVNLVLLHTARMERHTFLFFRVGVN